MIHLSKQYYFIVVLLVLAVFYGYKKHSETSNQQDYLNPHLLEMMHAMHNEIHTTSSILHTVMFENEIPYAQWIQLKNGFEAIERSSYEIEKMGRAIHPHQAQGLQNATKTTSHLILNQLNVLEDHFLEPNMDRLDIVTFPPEAHSSLEPIYDTTYVWKEISSQYHVTTNSIHRTYWIDMMQEMQEPSILFQHHHLRTS